MQEIQKFEQCKTFGTQDANKSRMTTLIIPFFRCYYSELRNAMMSYTYITFIPTKDEQIVRKLQSMNDFAWLNTKISLVLLALCDCEQ